MTQSGLAILDLIQTWRCAWLDVLMTIATYLGDNGAVWIALAVLLWLRPATRRSAYAIALALALSLLLCNLTLKPLFMRPRPFTYTELTLLVSAPTGWSFPSGHASASFAAATALLPAGRRWALPAYALAALIAFSRLYLYVHFPGDVLAGAILGTGCGLASIFILRQALEKRKAM